jgi:hypothetical protein
VLQATQRAEEIQRAQMHGHQRQSIEQHIDGIPDLSDHKRDFLKTHPEFVTDNFKMNLMRKAYADALAAGYVDDTRELNEAVLRGVASHVKYMRDHQALQVAPLRSDEPTRSSPPPPQRQAVQPDADLQELKPPPAPPIRRSIPVTAPVSREIPTASGQRQSSRQITLTPEEREVAHLSFRHLPADQAEAQYALNKARMLRLKAEGVIQGDG